STFQLSEERTDRLRHELRALQIGVGEAEDEELVVVRNLDSVCIRHGLEEVVVVRDPERVDGLPSLLYIRTKGDSLDLCRNISGGDAVRGQHLHDVEEQSLRHGEGQSGGRIHVADVDSVVQVNLEKLFDLGVVAVGAAVAIAFVHEEFVIVDGKN